MCEQKNTKKSLHSIRALILAKSPARVSSIKNVQQLSWDRHDSLRDIESTDLKYVCYHNLNLKNIGGNTISLQRKLPKKTNIGPTMSETGRIPS